MSIFRKVFHCSANKFFAVLFSGLALGVTIAWLVYSIVTQGRAFFTFTNIWNYFITFLIYGFLFFYNIRNDNRAYTAISLLLFACIIGSFIDIIYDFVNMIRSGFSGDTLLLLPALAMDVLIMTIGILTFVQLNSYRIGRNGDYRKVRLHLILFAISVILPSLVTSFIFLARGAAQDAWVVLVTALVAEFADLCAAVACVFTFNRLIR